MFASVTSRFNLKHKLRLTCSGNPEEDPRAGQASNREVAEGKRYLRNSKRMKDNCGTPSLPPSCET